MPLDYAVDPYLERMATPRKGLRVDDIAQRYQGHLGDIDSTIAALRAYPRNQAAVQDLNSQINYTDAGLGEGTRGTYDPKTNNIYVKAGMGPEQTRRTTYHEMLHRLREQGDGRLGNPRPPASNAPQSVMDPVSDKFMQSMDIPARPGYEGSPRDFGNAISKAGMYYGSDEPAAWIASSLNQPVKMDPQVRQVAAQFPGMAGMFAAQNAQPNRPAPQHMRGYPEMSKIEQWMADKGWIDPTAGEVSPEAKYSVMQQQVLRRLNEETNPRDRR